jgi:hypothetical protein
MHHMKIVTPLLFVTLLGLPAGPAAAPPGQIAPGVQPPRDPQGQAPQAVGTGSISGAVTVADSGQAARKVRVTLSGSELRGARSLTTDDQGRFSFVSLPAGRFMLSASKPGYVNVSYGQRTPGPGRPGTAIQLADNQRLEVQLQIPRGGVITGTVLDEHGEAIPGTPVRVMRYTTQSGERRLQQAGSGSTDDRGIYRVYGLQPGEYIVAATPRNTGSAAMADQLRAQVEQMRVAAAAGAARGAAAQILERVEAMQAQVPAQDEAVSGYAPVYYPGTTAPASAAAVSVGIGQERPGVDFQLQLVPIARVEGVVVTTTGQAAQNIQVSLVNIGYDVPGIGSATARPDRDGRFRIPNVAPGQYLLVARGTMGGPAGREMREAMTALEERRVAVAGRGAGRGQVPDAVRLWAMTDVSVDGRNVDNLVLTLQPGMTVSGRVAFDGATAQPPADLSRLRVSLSPFAPTAATRLLATAVQGRVDASGKFTIAGVSPGRYRLTGSGAGPGWTVGSSVVSGQDTLDVPLEVKPNQSVSNAVLTFTDRQTEVTGTLVDAKGQPAPDYTIIIYPAEREYWTPQSRRVQSARPATDGRFIFRNLPAGEYRVAAVLDPEPGTWYDPQFLQQLESSSMHVPLGPGEKKVQNLRVGGQ